MNRFFRSQRILVGSFIFISLYTGALFAFATTYVSPGTILDPLGIPGSYTVTPPLTYGGVVTSGHDNEVTYIDASGNLASDDLFTRDSGDAKQTDIFSNTYAQGSTNDGISEQVTFQADTIGTAGNSVSLVFNGTDDAQTVMDAWNVAHPSNTVSIVNGVGTTVPTAGTVTLIGGGTTGFSAGVFSGLLGDIQGSGTKLEDTTNNLTTFNMIGNLSSTVASSSLGNMFGSINANTGALSAGIFQSDNFQIMSTDQNTYNNLIQADDVEISFQSNGIGFRADTGGFVGWYDNGASTEFALPTGLPASTSYVLGVSALNANTATLDWVLPGGGLTGYTDNPNTALGIDTAATGVGQYNTFLGNGAGYNVGVVSSDRNTLVGQDVIGTSTTGGPYEVANSTFVGQQINIFGDVNDVVAIGQGINFGAAIDEAVTIGASASGANYSVALGYNASNVGHNNSIAIGRKTINTASNQMVVGSDTNPIIDFYFGNGVTNAGLTAGTNLHATGGSGLNNFGGLFTILGGQSTGNIPGGSFLVQVSPAGASGSTPNTYHTFLDIGGDKISTFGDVDDVYYGLRLDIDNNAGGINLGNQGGAGGNSTNINISDSLQTILLGDTTNTSTGTQLIIDSATEYVTAQTDGRFRVTDTTFNEWFKVDTTSKIGEMGDVGGVFNGTKISVNDSTQSISFNYNSDSYTFPIGDGTTDYVLATDGAGQLFWQDPTLIPSDQTLKSNIAPSTYGLSTLLQLNPVSYTLNVNNKQQIGFIAQEVEPLIPELIGEIAGGKKGLAYGQLSAVIVKSIQELDLKIKPLEDLLSENNSFANILRNFLASAVNGIEQIITRKIKTEELCIEDVCVTRDQFLRMVEQGGNGTSGNSTSGSGSTTSGDSGTSGDGTGSTTSGDTGNSDSGTTTSGDSSGSGDTGGDSSTTGGDSGTTSGESTTGGSETI